MPTSEDLPALKQVGPSACVIIPTYNRLDILPTCLLHLEKQTFDDFEVLVIDDGSTDGTAAFLLEYAASTKLAFRHLHQQNSGPARARNAAISVTNATICVIIGDDILVSSSFLETHFAFHVKNTAEQDVALGLTQWSESLQTVTPFMRWMGDYVQFDYKSLLGGTPPDWTHFYTSNLSAKRTLLLRNPFDERFRKALLEDSELGYRLLQRENMTLTFLPKASADHVHPMEFAKACRRAYASGRSLQLFESIWPDALPRKSRSRTAFRFLLGHSPWVLAWLTWLTDVVTRVWCPNPLLRPVLSMQADAGRYARQSQALLADSNTRE